MLYSEKERAITEVAFDEVGEKRMRELAALPGKKTDGGEPIELVRLVFMRVEPGEASLALCKQYGIGCRVIEEGQERELFAGARVRFEQTGKTEGTLLPLLREEKWPHLETVVHRRLIPGPVDQGPWVTFGIDAGDSVARFGPHHLGDRTIADIEKRALENLAARKTELQEIGPGILRVAEEYAAETVLLPDFMKKLQAKLGCKMMLVNIPHEQMLVASDGDDLDRTRGMIAIARKHFDEAKGRRISALPLVVQDGAIIGYVTGMTEEDEKANKPWWKFW